MIWFWLIETKIDGSNLSNYKISQQWSLPFPARILYVISQLYWKGRNIIFDVNFIVWWYEEGLFKGWSPFFMCTSTNCQPTLIKFNQGGVKIREL